MKFDKFESVLFIEEILIFKGVTDWLQAVRYKTLSDSLNNYLEDSRTDYNSNYDMVMDNFEHDSDNLSDSITERIHDIYLYIEFGTGAVMNEDEKRKLQQNR